MRQVASALLSALVATVAVVTADAGTYKGTLTFTAV
jgi:hypothetical protein